MSESGRGDDAARFRKGFERRIVVRLLTLEAAVLALGVWALVQAKPSQIVWVAGLTALLVFLAAMTASVNKALVEPLRGLTNVVEAYRKGDYTLRGSREVPGDALGDLVHEINSLGSTLHQQRLQAMEATALLEKLIGAISIAVLAFDTDGKLRVRNPAAAQLLRLDAEGGYGLTATDLGVQGFLDERIPTRIVTQVAGRNGRWQITQGTFREGGLVQHLLLISDVQQALREEERLAWQRLIRVMGHEVNNSLAPIKSLAETLEELLAVALPAGAGRAETLDGLRVIAERTRSLARFLSQYGRLARLPPPRRRWLHVASVVARVTALETLHKIEADVPARLEVYVDEDQLEHALINLSRNATEALQTPGGRVLIVARHRHGDLVLEVIDEGGGIANPDNLFVPFFTTKQEGSGVGLVLSRQIAEAHGGTLTLENRDGVSGAVATLEIPGAARLDCQ
jgi:two-component system nitrogen regulation sensor histidine kinase NtrY